MNILFGEEQAKAIADKYPVLELDLIQIGEKGPVVTAYCAVENIPLEEVVNLVDTQAQHQTLIKSYRSQQWNKCLQLIEQLTGCWGGELDSFYATLKSRIDQYVQQDPGPDWTGVVVKIIRPTNS
jgi:hypothetical protein